MPRWVGGGGWEVGKETSPGTQYISLKFAQTERTKQDVLSPLSILEDS